MFLDSLLFDAVSSDTKSLNALSINTKGKYNIEITKQGIDQRFTPEAVKYVQALCSEQLSDQLKRSVEPGWFNQFERVLIKDSTKFEVSDTLAQQFPAPGGSAYQAGVCIQYEFDIKSGEVNDLSINPATSNDKTDTKETLGKIRKGDLIIRDLGYSVIPCFKTPHTNGAYFLSRLTSNVVVFEWKNNELIELDFPKLYKEMTKYNIKRLSKNVIIGEKARMPVRLIIDLMPEQEINKRKRHTKQRKKGRGHKADSKFMNRVYFNLFVTNIDEKTMEPKIITKIYKMRWQVELVFKAWKSVFGINCIGPMKYERLMCLLNIRLLLILINWELIMRKRSQVFEATQKLLSIIKCFKTLHEHNHELRHILTNNCKELAGWRERISKLLESNHWLEKKNKKMGLMEIIELKVL